MVTADMWTWDYRHTGFAAESTMTSSKDLYSIIILYNTYLLFIVALDFDSDIVNACLGELVE